MEYLRSHPTILDRTHFVEEAIHTPRSLVMTANGMEGAPFRFYKGNLMTADSEKAFHDIRLNPDQDLYIELVFPKDGCIEYYGVLEDNPHVVVKSARKEDCDFAEQFTNDFALSLNKEVLLQRIDEALDARDKERFMELTSNYLVTS
jgi:uncharacterized protein YpiB (UPF0302 family)